MKTTLVSTILALALMPNVSFAQQAERGQQRQRAERTEQQQRAERPNRADRADRPERPERPNRPDRPNRPERPDRPERPERPDFDSVWQEHDTDGDGFLSLAEFQSMPRVARLPEDQQARLFERLDKNNDGKLSKEEMRGMRQPRDDGRPAPGMRRLMELDTDGSGGVSLDELRAAEMFSRMPAERLEALFRRLDTDGDGEITPKDRPELPRAFRQRPDGPRGERPQPPNPRVVFQRLDTNNDGELSFLEFRKAPGIAALDEDAQEALFLRLDRNGDHRLTHDEFAAIPVERLLQQPQRRGGPDARGGQAPRPDPAAPRTDRRRQRPGDAQPDSNNG